MTREIKFRAWNFKKKSMYPVDMIAFELDGGLRLARSVVSEIETVEHTPTTCQIMSFTGFLDKKKKEIFEGDIIGKVIDKYNTDYHNRQTTWLKVVEWDEEEGTWGIREKYIDKDEKGLGPMYEDSWDDDYTSLGDCIKYSSGVKVIGNIYEYKKLLT